MKIRFDTLKRLIAEVGKISAHPSYMKKEQTREKVQAWIIEAIESGTIFDQKSFDEFVGTVDMSMKALKMVPFDVFKKMAASKPV